jgi:hypothetical protein
VDLDSQFNSGTRPNNELSRVEVYGTVTQQLTPEDSLYVQTSFQDYRSGDNFQYYDPAQARPNFYYNEYQTPGARVAGYHHQWAPGSHTLALAGWLHNDQRIGDQSATNLLVIRNAQQQITAVGGLPFDVKYQSVFDVFTGELNQILQNESFTLVAGCRIQSGQFHSTDSMLLAPGSIYAPVFPKPPSAADVTEDFNRAAGYGYLTWKLRSNLQLTGGLDYDTITMPGNLRSPPLTTSSTSTDHWGPKAAASWSPFSFATLRGAYSRSLGGVSFEDSYRLEPTQLEGFVQSFRTLIPESLVGSVSAPAYETVGVALDLKLRTRTYLTLEGQWLQSTVNRDLGVFQSPPVGVLFKPATLAQTLDYDERSAGFALNQLAGREWAFALRYRYTWAQLDQRLPAVPLTIANS